MYSERTGTPSKQTIASTVMAIACGFAEANFVAEMSNVPGRARRQAIVYNLGHY